MKLLAPALLAASLSVAPLQCGGGQEDPALRRNETPDEALYGLATRFREQGRTDAWRATLEYLIDRYPNGRFAARARGELGPAP